MTVKYDWRSVLTGHVRWRVLYREMRIANPQASWLQCLWWTVRFPHTHSEEDFSEDELDLF